MAVNRIKILAIDDKPDNLTVLKAVISDALPNAEVFTAGSGQQGLALALAEDPDVILLDIVMPQMDGYEVCGRLKADARLRSIPVVFLTAIKTNKESRIKALEAGGEGFLPKPLEEAELIAQIQAMVKIKAGNVALLTEQERLNLELDERTHNLANETWEHQRTKKGRDSAESALRHSEQRFKALFEQAPLGYQSLDENGNFLEVNTAWCETLGYTKPEVIGKWFGDFLAPEYVEAFRQLFPIFKSQGSIHSEFFMLHKDGRRRFIAFEGRIGYKPDGTFQQTHCILKDITAQKAAEDSLSKNETLHKAMTENISDVIAIVDADCIIKYISPNIERLFGLRQQDLLGQEGWLTVHPEDLERIKKEFVSLLGKDKGVTTVEYRHICKNGSYRSIEMTAANLISAPAIAGVLINYHDITERKLKEEALKKEQLLSQAIVESIPGTFYMLDEKGCYVRWNAYQRDEIVGKPEGQMAGTAALGTIHPDDRALVQARIGNVLLSGADEVVEGRVLLRGGPAYRWLAMTGRRMIVDGHPFLVGTGIDITDSKQKNQELVESKNFLESVIENVPLMIFLKEAKDLRFEVLNRAGEELLGYDRKALLGKNDSDFFTPEQAAGFIAKDRQVLDGKDGFLDVPEEPISTAKKGDRLLHTRKVCIRGADGKAKYLLGISEDITERRLAEETLRESRSRLQAALSSMTDAVFISDTAGRFIEFNDAFATFHKFRDKAECAKQLSDYPYFLEVYLPDGKLVPLEMWVVPRALRGETGTNAEYKLRRKDTGQAWVGSYSFSPIRDEKGAIVGSVVVARDITQTKLTQEEAERLRSELQQAQKIESVGRLAGGVAHDFNNLLTAIGGYAGFLMRGMGKQDPGREDVKEILAATERAAGLTKQLLAFSRKQILNPQVVDLNAGVAGVVKMLKRLIGEQVQIQTKFAAQECRTKVDPGQIDQVLVNLAVNARDAMPNGGVLTLETAIVTPDASFSLRHPGLPQGPLVCLTVRDTGCGLTAEVRQHLFEPFFTTKEKGKGTGLGLSTVFGIVKQSGGEIEAESEPGSGTAFRMYFPCVDAPISDKDKDKDKDSLPRGTETILLVEDEDMLRRLGERVLKTDGYTVITAADGKSALEAAQRHGKPVDLLVTDVVMPGMSGRELAIEMSKRKLAHRTLYMSGYTDEAISNHGVLEDGIAFIYKPFSVEALSKKLREVLDGPADQAKS